MKLFIKMTLRIFLISLFISSLEAGELFKSSDEILHSKKIEFSNANSFICTLTPSTFSNAMLVNKDDGWSIFKESYFRKKDLLINIFNCTKTKTT